MSLIREVKFVNLINFLGSMTHMTMNTRLSSKPFIDFNDFRKFLSIFIVLRRIIKRKIFFIILVHLSVDEGFSLFDEIPLDRVSSLKWKSPVVIITPLNHQIKVFDNLDIQARHGKCVDGKTTFYVRGPLVCIDDGSSAELFTCFPPSNEFDLFPLVQKFVDFKYDKNNEKFFDENGERICPVDGTQCKNLNPSSLTDPSYVCDHILEKHLYRGWVCLQDGHIHGPIYSTSGMRCHLLRTHQVERQSKQMEDIFSLMEDFYDLKI